MHVQAIMTFETTKVFFYASESLIDSVSLTLRTTPTERTWSSVVTELTKYNGITSNVFVVPWSSYLTMQFSLQAIAVSLKDYWSASSESKYEGTERSALMPSL